MLDIYHAKKLYLNRVYSPSRVKMLYNSGKLGEHISLYKLSNDQLLELGFKIHNHVWLFPRWANRIVPDGFYFDANGKDIHTDDLGEKILFDDFNLNYGIHDAKRILPTGTQTGHKETRCGSPIPQQQTGWFQSLMGRWRKSR